MHRRNAILTAPHARRVTIATWRFVEHRTETAGDGQKRVCLLVSQQLGMWPSKEKLQDVASNKKEFDTPPLKGLGMFLFTILLSGHVYPPGGSACIVN